MTATVAAAPADPLTPSDGASKAGPVKGESNGQPESGAFQLD
jgi:hypothetical protein